MPGLLALHGGGEYVRGDEVAMDALVAAAAAAAGAAGDGVARIVVVPTAAARGRPAQAAANGERSFAAAASRAGIRADVAVVNVLSAADAADPSLAESLEAAHLVHFPGGDPDLIPAVFSGSGQWAAIERAY